PRRVGPPLAMSRRAVLPSTQLTVSAPGTLDLRGSMAGLHVPLPTLHLCPRGQRCTARGRRGSLLLRRIGLAPTTPCRSPGALAAHSPERLQQPVPGIGVGAISAPTLGVHLPSAFARLVLATDRP